MTATTVPRYHAGVLLADDCGRPIPVGFGPFLDLDRVVDANRAAGLHTFDADARAFFHADQDPRTWAGRFWIEATAVGLDPSDPLPERWSVQVAHDDGSCGTMPALPGYEGDCGNGGFRAYPDCHTAALAAQTFAAMNGVATAIAWHAEEADRMRRMAVRCLTEPLSHGSGRVWERENCAACALSGWHPRRGDDEAEFPDGSPNYAGWPRVYVQARRPIPTRWTWTFAAALLDLDNPPYALALRRDVATFGIRWSA